MNNFILSFATEIIFFVENVKRRIMCGDFIFSYKIQRRHKKIPPKKFFGKIITFFVGEWKKVSQNKNYKDFDRPIAEEERENIRRRQAEGIAFWKKTGKTRTGRPYGRPKIKMPSDWEKVYTLSSQMCLSMTNATILL